MKQNRLVPKLRFKDFHGESTVQSLEHIVKIIDCKHRTPNYVESGVPVVSPGTIKWGEIDLLTPTKRVTEKDYESLMDHCVPTKGDLVFSRNQSIGIASILLKEGKFVLGQDTVLIQAKKVNSVYNYYRLQTYNVQTLISRLSGGSTFARINLQDLRKLKVTIADNNDEQQKIASFLSAVDEKIQQLTRKKELLERYKKGVMQQLFSGKLRFKDEEGKDYPKWETKEFKDIVIEFRLGGNYPNMEGLTKFPLIKMGNLNRGKINIDKLEYIPTNEKIDSKDEIKYGDLFFNTRNTLDLVGKVAIWRNELPRAFYNSNLMYLKFSNNFFMNYRLNSYEGIKGLKRFATGTTSVAAIYTKDLLKLKLSMPKLEEQKKIAAFLIEVDNKIDSTNIQITQAQTFKKGLLQQMFV